MHVVLPSTSTRGKLDNQHVVRPHPIRLWKGVTQDLLTFHLRCQNKPRPVTKSLVRKGLKTTGIMRWVVSCMLVLCLTLLYQPTEGRSCRRPRRLRHGGYEYQSSDDYALSRLPEGYVVRVLCAPDARRVGDEFMICQDNGMWSSRSFCRGAVTCVDRPTSPGNGFVRVRGQAAGSIARYGCNFGFRLVGQRITVCNETTRSWEGEPPLCIRPLSCPVPTNLPQDVTVALRSETGHFIDMLYTEQSVLRFTCPSGHFPSHDVNITCLNGAWIADGEVPECNKIVCRPPTVESIEHLQSDIEDRDYDIGEEVQYKCDTGYLLDGKSWQVCQAGSGSVGVWTDRVPRCRVVQCPDPGPLHLDGDGQISFSSAGRGLGTVMSLRCSSHLTLLGSSERVCQQSGQWNGTLTSCNSEENYCPALGNPIHGSKVAPFSYSLNSVVRFRCDSGSDVDGNQLYEMVGSETRRCTVTGEWTGEIPRCMARDEFDDMERVTDIMGETFDALEIDGNYLGHHHDSSTSSRRKRAIDLSNDRGLDVFFAFDGSGSIGERSFKRGKRFAKLLVEKLFVSLQPGGARVGALVYSTEPRVIFHVTEFNETDEVLAAIESQVTRNGLLGTNMPIALELIKSEMIFEAVSTAPNNRRVLFIVTDGYNNMGGDPSKDARILKEEHTVAIHCIGISQDVNKKGLSALASEPLGEHIFFLRDYEQLVDAVNDVTMTNRSYDMCGKAGSVSGVQGRILGGTETKPGRWPWQAAIYKIDPEENTDVGFKCGGSLIDKEWVLTAAHCFRRMTRNQTAVYLGLTNRAQDILSDRSQRFRVAELVIHPEFDKEDPSYDNDIALLKLDSRADLNVYVREICLPPFSRVRKFIRPGKNAQVIGWGHQSIVDPSSPDVPTESANVLREITVPIASDELCSVKMNPTLPGNHKINKDVQFCAGDGQGTFDACEGDSGGPLMVKPQNSERYAAAGIVSFGYGCGLKNTYGVYTRVPTYVQWIIEQTGIEP